MPPQKKKDICEDEDLREGLKKCAFELISSLERQLKKQEEQGYPIGDSLKSIRRAKKALKKIAG